MYKAPLIVGVHQSSSWNQYPTVKETLLRLGENTGNMMFTEALLRVVASRKLGSFSLTEEELAGRDVIVVAAANWINSFEDFGWLAERIERTQLPIVMIGVGAQASLDMEVPKLKPGTLRLLELVKDRSTSIAARGSFTCEVLSAYGIKTGIATGCPSLLLATAAGPTVSSHESIRPELCTIHSTRHGFNRTDDFHTYLYRQALNQDLDIILQSEVADIYVALGRDEQEFDQVNAVAILTSVYGIANFKRMKTYLGKRARIFTNFEGWINYMKGRQFCAGTRIHGTVASIIAGTPSTLIVHDSRTLEMAESMSIPYIMSSEIDSTRQLDLPSLLRPEEMKAMTLDYHKYRTRYMEFFDQNGLAFNIADGY